MRIMILVFLAACGVDAPSATAHEPTSSTVASVSTEAEPLMTCIEVGCKDLSMILCSKSGECACDLDGNHDDGNAIPCVP